MATKDKTVPVQQQKPSGGGGKTNEDMKSLGRGLAKVANQKRSK